MPAKTHILTRPAPCPLTGQPCPVAQSLLEALGSAMVQAGHVVVPDCSLTGAFETRACGRSCRLHRAGRGAAVEVSGAATGPVLRAELLQGWLA